MSMSSWTSSTSPSSSPCDRTSPRIRTRNRGARSNLMTRCFSACALAGAALACAGALALCASVSVSGVQGMPYQTETLLLLQPCPREVPQEELNSCVATTITKFLRNMKNGFSSGSAGSGDLDLPPLDPLRVDHLEMMQGSGKVGVTIHFYNVKIEGLSKSSVSSAKMNVHDRKLEVSLKTPVFEMSGDYECSGGVYELPLSSSGKFAVTMTDVTSAWMLYFVAESRSNATSGSWPGSGEVAADGAPARVFAERFLVDVSPANVVYRFDKKFDGENSLGEAMDSFMNENALEIYNNVKPKVMKMFSDLFLQLTNQVLLRYPKSLVLAT